MGRHLRYLFSENQNGADFILCCMHATVIPCFLVSARLHPITKFFKPEDFGLPFWLQLNKVSLLRDNF